MTVARRMQMGAAGVPTGSFDPLTLSPTMWLDASDTATITESGGAVSQWDDKSGNAHHMTQGTAGSRPTTGSATKNSLNVISFDGTEYMSQAHFSPSTTAFTIVGVAAPTGASSRVWATMGNNSHVGISHNAFSTYGGLLGGVAWVITSTASESNNSWTAQAFVVNNGTNSMYRNNTALTLTGGGSSTPSSASSNTEVGGDSTQQLVPVDIAELLTFDSVLTSGQLGDLWTYLSSKWGL